MRNLIISPHTDDAIFSIGKAIAILTDVYIATPLHAVPEDEPGKTKHLILNTEHDIACKIVGAQQINGPFFDDVYGKQDTDKLYDWLYNVMVQAENVYIPLGIKHPDHILISDLCIDALESGEVSSKFHFYEELPYAYDYSLETSKRAEYLQDRFPQIDVLYTDQIKHKGVAAYVSQTGNDVISRIFSREERIWQ